MPFWGNPGREMKLNAAGEMVHGCWNELSAHYPHVILDSFIVMPNHIHGVVIVTDIVGAPIM